jgi:hypothetical protein
MKNDSVLWTRTWRFPVLVAFVGSALLYLLLPVIDKGLKPNQPGTAVDRKPTAVTVSPRESAKELGETAQIEPVEVTAWDLARFPKVYEQRKRVHIIRWSQAWVLDVDDLRAGRKGNINPMHVDYARFPTNCKFFIVIGGLPLNCLSTVPEVFAPGPNLTKLITGADGGRPERRALEFTVSEDFADLACEFQSNVWNCALSPSDYFRMKEREREHYKEMEDREKELEKSRH